MPFTEIQSQSQEGPDRRSQFQKTRMCKFFELGICKRGSGCSFAHSDCDKKAPPDLSRTRLCENFFEGCKNPTCLYAHSQDELRATKEFLKTKTCKYWASGHCALGNRCRYAHGGKELRESALFNHGKSKNTEIA